MDRISSLDQYKKIIATAKDCGYKLTNCYFLAVEIMQKINRGVLYFCQIENGFLLLEDADDFYRCYYYLSDVSLPEKVTLKKDAVIELPYNGKIAEKQFMQIKRIESMGFCLGRESSMMRASADEVRVSASVGIGCGLASEEDTTRILDLLYQSFNPLYAFLPTECELHRSIRDNKVFTITHQNRVVGALVSGINKRIAVIEQIVMDPTARGNGFGGQLLNYYHQYYRADVSAFQHWVDINNESAIRMYRKAGYGFASRKANEYILINGGQKK